MAKVNMEPVPLVKELVFAAMVEYIESKSIRFNRDMLDQYLNMRIPLIKQGIGFHSYSGPKETMTRDTLRRWCLAFIQKYTETY
jgi:hypothetical protein